jgi:hypothetical protein
MKEKFVGIYELGFARVKVFLREGTGANTSFFPKGNGIAEIRIGADRQQWGEVVGSLLHESQETCLSNMSCEYVPFQAIRRSTSNTTLFMTHEQFDESCARSGEFIAACLPALSLAWEHWNKSKIVKKKGRKK